MTITQLIEMLKEQDGDLEITLARWNNEAQKTDEYDFSHVNITPQNRRALLCTAQLPLR